MKGMTPRSPSDGTDVDALCAQVAAILWREREQLEQLLFCLTTQQLILDAGALRWLTAADERVAVAADAVANCELERAVETNELARALGLSGDAHLEELVASVDEPWSSLLGEHREALRGLVSEITTTTAANRRLLRTGADIAQEALDHVRSVTPSFHADGTTTSTVLDRKA
jgi:hypothetical protein